MPMLEVQLPGDMLNCGGSVTGQDHDREAKPLRTVNDGERITPQPLSDREDVPFAAASKGNGGGLWVTSSKRFGLARCGRPSIASTPSFTARTPCPGSSTASASGLRAFAAFPQYEPFRLHFDTRSWPWRARWALRRTFQIDRNRKGRGKLLGRCDEARGRCAVRRSAHPGTGSTTLR